MPGPGLIEFTSDYENMDAFIIKFVPNGSWFY